MYLDSVKLSARVSWPRAVVETELLRTEAHSSPAPRGLAEEMDGEQLGAGRKNREVSYPGDLEKRTLQEGASG